MPSMVENSINFPSDIYVCMQQRITKFYYIVILNLIVSAWYLHWRIAYSLNLHALWLSIPLLLAEIYLYIRITIFLVQLWHPNWQPSKFIEQKKHETRVKHAQLVNRLKQLDNITKEVSQAEQLLNSFQIEVKTEPEDLIKVLIWFEELRQSFIPTHAWLECQTVLGEAFDNVICHAHHKMPHETPIQLKVEIFNHSMIIKVWDYGPGFDLEKYCQNKEKESIDLYAENGRGIQIITEVADYCSYTRQLDERNCLLIIKSFAPNTEQQKQNSSDLLGYLYSFYQFMLLSNPQYNQIQDYLDEEKKNIEDRIKQQELAEKKSFSFSKNFNLAIMNKISYLVTFIFFLSPLAYFYTKTIPLQAYNSEFSVHFMPAILLNFLTFFSIGWDVNSHNKWHSQLCLLRYIFVGKYNFCVSGINGESNLLKYRKEDKSILSVYWLKLILCTLTIISIFWGGYQMITDDFYQYFYYSISLLWSIVNLLFLFFIIKEDAVKKDDILKY